MYESEGAKVLEELEKRAGGLPQALWNTWHKMWTGEIDGISLTREEQKRLVSDPYDLESVSHLHPFDAKLRREKTMQVFWDTILRFPEVDSTVSLPTKHDAGPLTKEEIMNKIKDFSENFPMYNKPPEEHYRYQVYFIEFLVKVKTQIGLSEEIERHALAVFDPSYTCPGYPGYDKQFSQKTNIYGQRYMGIRSYILPLLKDYVEENYKESTDQSDQTKKKKQKDILPSWDGTQRLIYHRSKRKLFVNDASLSVPKHLAPQTEVLLDLAVERYNKDENWVVVGRWSEVLHKEGNPCKGDENRAFREAFERLSNELEETLQQVGILEWGKQAVRIKKKS